MKWPSDRNAVKSYISSIIIFGLNPEVIDWLIKDKAFSPSYDLAPRPPPSLPHLSSARCLSFAVLLCVAGRSYTDRRGGEGAGEESNNTTARKLVLYKSVSTLWFNPYWRERAEARGKSQIIGRRESMVFYKSVNRYPYSLVDSFSQSLKVGNGSGFNW
jgi:hypothetical protein